MRPEPEEIFETPDVVEIVEEDLKKVCFVLYLQIYEIHDDDPWHLLGRASAGSDD